MSGCFFLKHGVHHAASWVIMMRNMPGAAISLRLSGCATTTDCPRQKLMQYHSACVRVMPRKCSIYGCLLPCARCRRLHGVY